MALTIDNKLVEEYRSKVLGAKNIVIISHTNPDGDALGSLLGTKLLVSKAAKQALSIVAILPNVCPETFRFLPQNDTIFDADTCKDMCEQRIALADLIICVDFNNASRVGILQDALESSCATKILVDHHEKPDYEFFDTVISEPSISSASELSFWLGMQAWGKESFDQDVATCFYTGICTDTGSFAYSCDAPSLYEAVGCLMQYDVKGATIHNLIFNTFSVNRMRLLGYCISERLKIFESEHFAYFYLSNEDQKRFEALPGDLEVIVNYTLMMKNIEVGAFVKETPDGKVRISFRSKFQFNVNEFARKHFNGGGHVKAAGATSPYDFETTVKKVESLLREEISQKKTEEA